MRVLLLSCSFPPIGGMTPLLAAQFARELVRRGHEVDVLTIDPSARHPIYRLDPASEAIVPPAVRVTRAYAGPLHHAAGRFAKPGDGLAAARKRRARGERVAWRQRLALALRPLLFPDSRIDCAPWVIAAGRRLIRRSSYDVLLSIAPPDTDTVIAWALAAPANLPWVTHQGDLWTFGLGPEIQAQPRWRRALDRAVERRLMRRMDRIMVLTPEMRDLCLSVFPTLPPEKFTIVTPGFDPAEYAAIPPEQPPPGVFRIAYTGLFYEGTRQPDQFFEGVARMAAGRRDIEVVVAGNVGQDAAARIARLCGDARTVFLGHQPHHRVVALQKGASLLLLLCWEGGYGFAAKAFEYIAARRPILAIDYDGRDPAARFVMTRRRGIAVPNDAMRVRDALADLHDLWAADRLTTAFELDDVPEFTWSSVGQRLEETLLEACETRRGAVRASLLSPAGQWQHK